MHALRGSFLLAVALTALISLISALPCAAQLPATDLGVLPDRVNSYATDMNGSGQVIGMCMNLQMGGEDEGKDDWSTALPFIWQNGTMTALPLLTGSNAGFVWDINASGQIVGSCDGQACLWTPNDAGWTVTGLGIPEGYTGSVGRYINDAGQIVMQCYTSQWPFIVSCLRDIQGGVTALLDTTGFPLGVTQINSAGQVLGQGGPAAWGAVLWTGGEPTDLVPSEFGIYMNDLGQVVGAFGDQSSGYSVESDFIYLPEPSYGLPAGVSKWPVSTMGGYFGGINNAGQILLVPSPVDDGYGFWKTDVIVCQLGGSVVYQVTVPGETHFNRVAINANGQISGEFMTADEKMGGFYADSVTGFTLLSGLGGQHRPIGLNDSGIIFGEAQVLRADGTLGVHACVWRIAPALVVSKPTVIARNAKVVTVTVTVTNPNKSTAYDVTVTAASLGGSVTNSVLPLVYGALKPGASKQCTLQFKNVPSGPQTLTINGTSSLGAFFTTQTVTVP